MGTLFRDGKGILRRGCFYQRLFTAGCSHQGHQGPLTHSLWILQFRLMLYVSRDQGKPPMTHQRDVYTTFCLLHISMNKSIIRVILMQSHVNVWMKATLGGFIKMCIPSQQKDHDLLCNHTSPSWNDGYNHGHETVFLYITRAAQTTLIYSIYNLAFIQMIEAAYLWVVGSFPKTGSPQSGPSGRDEATG